jgi:hypothetical protein
MYCPLLVVQLSMDRDHITKSVRIAHPDHDEEPEKIRVYKS